MKCLQCVCTVLLLSVQAECSDRTFGLKAQIFEKEMERTLKPFNKTFIDDSCIAESEAGICKLLSECDYLIREIKRAGSPMPAYLRRKLHALNCGFDYDEPKVCCTMESEESYERPVFGTGSTQSFETSTRPKNPWLTKDETTSQYPNIINTNFNNNNKFNDDNRGSSNINGQSNNRRNPNMDILPRDCGVIEEERVFGGNRTRLFEMPWMVLIVYDSARGTKLSCGGTLITEWYVLTAAHCVSFLGERLTLSGIILGEYDIRQDPDCERQDGELVCAQPVRTVKIDTVIPHPGYSPQNLFDDIALVRLAERADFSLFSMKPICLPTTPELRDERLDGRLGVVAGWGATEDGLQSPVLLKVELPIVTNTECQTAYNGSPRIYDKQLCAGGIRDKDSCGGDSGGPLMVPGRIGSSGTRYVQRGIVSYGSKRCGIGGYPGVYTRVSAYIEWILDNIRR